jgi:hypothetical protein
MVDERCVARLSCAMRRRRPRVSFTSAVLQELELADVDEDCMLSFPEFVTFTRYLSQREALNTAILQIIRDECVGSGGGARARARARAGEGGGAGGVRLALRVVPVVLLVAVLPGGRNWSHSGVSFSSRFPHTADIKINPMTLSRIPPAHARNTRAHAHPRTRTHPRTHAHTCTHTHARARNDTRATTHTHTPRPRPQDTHTHTHSHALAHDY